MPATSMNAPARAVSSNSASARSAGSTPARADPAARAAALVVVITIRWVPAENPPAIGPAKEA